MRADDFKRLLDERPFRPLRVLITSGQYVDIVHPETAIVGRSYFAAARRPNKQGIAQGGLAVYNLIHVVKIVPLTGGRKRARRKNRSA